MALQKFMSFYVLLFSLSLALPITVPLDFAEEIQCWESLTVPYTTSTVCKECTTATMTTVIYYNTTTSLASREALSSTTETSLKTVPSRYVRDVLDSVNLETYTGRLCEPLHSEATTKANIGSTVGRIPTNVPMDAQSNHPHKKVQPIKTSNENCANIRRFSKLFLVIYFFQ